jgi:hypothetical protein
MALWYNEEENTRVYHDKFYPTLNDQIKVRRCLGCLRWDVNCQMQMTVLFLPSPPPPPPLFFSSPPRQSLKGAQMVYLGNLSFFTTESQIHALASRVGRVRRIIMGLNRMTKTPCGFCFVE